MTPKEGHLPDAAQEAGHALIQAACITSAARLLAHGVYPKPNNVLAIDTAVANIAFRLYTEFRARLAADGG